jgi:molybdate transport system substrate-binding protein
VTIGRRGIVALGAIAVWLAIGAPGRVALADDGPPPLVFAASSLAGVLEAVVEAAGTEARIAYGGSGQLARQIDAGAGADLFISAHPEWIAFLGEHGRIVADKAVTLFSNRLVIAAAPGNDVELDLRPGADIAAAVGDGRLAMGDPDHVPAGTYGREALRWLRAWEALAPKVARTDNVRAALALVVRGEAPLGIVYETDARAASLRVAGRFPPESHEPVTYVAVPVAGGREAAALRLIAALDGAAARRLISEFGFLTAE